MARGRGRGRGRGVASSVRKPETEEAAKDIIKDETPSTRKLRTARVADATTVSSLPTRRGRSSRVAKLPPPPKKEEPVAGPSRKRRRDEVEAVMSSSKSKAENVEPKPSTSQNSAPKKKPGRKPRPTAENILQAEDEILSTPTSDWNPYTVFPKEVWEMIFDNLKNPKDMEAIINTCPEFREMYMTRRTTLLFEQIVTTLSERDKPRPYGRPPWFHHSVDKYLDRDDYLRCRQVCRSWDSSVQSYIQNHPIHYQLENLPEDNELQIYGLQDYSHQTWQEQEQFAWYLPEYIDDDLREMSKTHPPEKNPFVTRRITLHDVDLACPCCQGGGRPMEDAYAQRWWASVVAMLERYGRHVWHCYINFHRNMTPLAWYVHIQHWINLMQNLKTLEVVYSIDETRLRRRDVNQLDNQIAISPLPELTDVVFLKTYDVPSPVFNELVRRVPNLQKLQIKMEGKNGVRLSQYDLRSIPSTYLKEAYITLVSNDDFVHLERSVRSWPLEKLYFNMETSHFNNELGYFPRWPEWNRIFSILEEKFSETLTELKLRLPYANRAADKKRILEENLEYRLFLPHVKSLRVVLPNLTSLDFLLPMKNSLEELILIVDHCESKSKDAVGLKRNEVVKFNGNFTCLFKSNIWKEFPKLKIVEIFVLKALIPMGRRQRQHYSRYFYNKETMQREIPPPRPAKRRRVRPRMGWRRFDLDDDFMCSVM